MKKPQLAFFVCFAGAIIGCTSLLGDFDVSKSSSNDTGDSGGGGACTPEQTKCGDTCVDTKTNATNCGACNRACPNGLACSDGNCQCPDKGAFCDGQCFARTDREHCGPTCATCAGNQVCDGQCADPPPPAFDKLPRSATGWKDAANAPLTVTVKATNQPGTKYECRTAPIGKFTPTVPEWKSCDGASGDGTTHQPPQDPTTPEGTYLTEYRYKLGPYTSPVISARYYVHKSLDGVATCPRQGVPLDGPHFSDEQYFAVAQAFATANAGAFPTANAFPAGGEKRSDAIYLGNPWIKIPFARVSHTRAMDASSGMDDDPWPPAGKEYLFNERSLRHKWVLNAARTMVLVSRQYIHPKTNDCKDRYEIGNKLEVGYGPPGRGFRKLECEAYVLNTQGNAICLMPNANKPEPLVVPIDSRVPVDDSQDGGQSLGATFQLYAGNTYVYSSTAVFTPAMVGGYLQIPENQFGRWYKIASVSSGTVAYLTEGFAGTPNPGPTMSARFAPNAVTAFVIGTGFAKLHQDAHAWATGKKRIPAVTGPQISQPLPSHRTKCETPGCNVGKPWLTYLPP
ncbi:MAG TPA: hypothetical protein VM925_23315 [Labilithrix sp.]|nr:hypothetical protein [Labilithrix sp.]